MRSLIITVLLLAIGTGPATSPTTLAYNQAASQKAAIGPARVSPAFVDHYGDPTRFTRYIIAIPPVLA